MKKRRSILVLILAFIFAQFAWMGLLGLWIYWYVSNYLIFEKVGDKLSPQIEIGSPNTFIFVGGIILIVGIAVAMFFIFRNLTVQLKLTGLYDNFIANVTHELKSPLSSIQLHLETLLLKNVPQEKQKEFIGIMIKDANRLNKLINSILEVSRLEQKKLARNYHIYEADEVFRSITASSKDHFRLGENKITIEESANGKCVIDKDAMQIVFDNLTDNSLKYSPLDASIIVKIYNTKKNIVIDFTDKGIGIHPKDQKKVFNKFYRAQNTNSPNVKGTGLGLYWVKEIIKLHGGKVRVFSEGHDKGTTITIELPKYLSTKIFYINSLLRSTAKKQKETEKENGG